MGSVIFTCSQMYTVYTFSEFRGPVCNCATIIHKRDLHLPNYTTQLAIENNVLLCSGAISCLFVSLYSMIYA